MTTQITSQIAKGGCVLDQSKEANMPGKHQVHLPHLDSKWWELPIHSRFLALTARNRP